MLRSQRGDPQMVVGDRGSGAFELDEKASVVFDGFPGCEQYRHGVTLEEAGKQSLVVSMACSTVEARFDFSQHDIGNPDFLAGSEKRRKVSISPKQVGQPIGVESNSHFYLSGSIRRWETITSSNPGSGSHWPTRSEKSAFTGLPMRARVNSSRTTRLRLCFWVRSFRPQSTIYFPEVSLGLCSRRIVPAFACLHDSKMCMHYV